MNVRRNDNAIPATTGAALKGILSERLGADKDNAPKGVVTLCTMVDVYFAAGTGTLTVNFDNEGAAVTVIGGMVCTVPGPFTNRRPLTLTDELIVCNGVRWQAPHTAATV